MNIRVLEYLIAVAEHEHFGKAADACHVSQPALSMQIKSLEQNLGIAFFERNTKRVIITEAGRVMVHQAQQIVHAVKDMKEQARALQNPYAGTCRLGAFPTLAPYVLPKIVPGLKCALPDLRLVLVEEKTETLLQQLMQGTLDSAFIALPIQESSLHLEPIFTDPFVLAVSTDHHLSKMKSVVLSCLMNENVLLLEEGHCLGDQALAVCHRVHANTHGDFRATSLETLREMVAMNEGVTLMPTSAIKTSSRVTYIPFQAPPPCRVIGLAWRKSSARQRCFEKISHTVRALLP